MKYNYMLVNTSNNTKVKFESKKDIAVFVSENLEVKSTLSLVREIKKVETILIADVIKFVNEGGDLKKSFIDPSIRGSRINGAAALREQALAALIA
jgi:hypothetical protein